MEPRWSWSGTSTTSSSSGRAVRACGPRSKPTRAARAPPSSASPCWARRTRSWPRAASPRRWPTSTPRTTGGCTSATPCAAGRCSTTGGWRSCTRRRRRTGSASSRTGARCSTARPDGLISQRDFGGHRYARLAHVGDRTGLELIRTLQQRTVALGIDVYMECTVTRLLDRTTTGITGAFGYWRESGRFVAWQAPSVVLATGGIGKSYKVTSNSWEYTGDGHSLALQAGATLVNMEFVQFHPTGHGLAAVGARDPGDRERPRRRRHPEELGGQPLHVRLHPRLLPQGDGGDRGRGRPLVRRQEEQPAPARAAPPRRGRPRDQQRGEGRPRHPARRRLPRHRLAPVGGVHPQAAAVDVPPVQGAGRGRHHRRGDGGRADLPLRDGRGGGRPRHRGRPRARACSRPARSPAACTGRTGWAATPCPTCWSSDGGPGAAAAEHARGHRHRAELPDDALADAARAALAPFDREGGENPYTVQHDLQQTMHDLVGIIRTAPEMEQALERIAALKERVANLSVEGHRQYNPGWHLALDLPHMLVVSECIARAALEREESRGGHTRDDFPAHRCRSGRRTNLICSQAADGVGGADPAAAAADAGRARRDLRGGRHDATTRRSGCGAATPPAVTCRPSRWR